MRTPDNTGLTGGLPSFPLRVTGIEPGGHQIARLLSPRYGGLFYHWNRGRSVYCTGNDCPAHVHKLPRCWKGYCAVELYRQNDAMWVPTVLEVSEHLELDFRHVYKRGQIWQIWRDKPSKKRNEPVQGRLTEECDPDHVPPPFSIVECLLHLYHVEVIDLSAKNPLPDRVIVKPSPAEQLPACLRQQHQEHEETADEMARKRQMLRDHLRNGFGRKPAAEKPVDHAHRNGTV